MNYGPDHDFQNDPNWNPDNVVLGNNPYLIDYNTGYNDSSISGSTVLMSADDWDKQHGRS